MLILLVKVALAPLAVLVASLLSRRLGPRARGFFIGLPTTSVPFLLAVHLSMGGEAAEHAAVGNVTGQLTCVLFCLLFARLAPLTGGVRTMLIAVTLAASLSAPTLLLHTPLAIAALVVVLAAVGLLLRGGETAASDPARPEPRWALPARMGLVALVVVTLSSLAPHVGPTLAAFLASLPTILMVLGPLTHRAQGPVVASSLVSGCVGSVPGTVAYLVGFLLIAPSLGPGLALVAALAAIPAGVLVTSAVAWLMRPAGRWVGPGMRRVLRPAFGGA